MDQHRRVRQRLLELVVVGDDQFQPEALRLLRLFQAGDAAIDGDDQRGAVRRDLPQRIAVESVTLFEPVRHVQVRRGAEQAEDVEEDGGAGHAVHVVIAVDAQAAAGTDGGEDAVGCLGHARQQFRRMQSGQGSVEEAAGLGGIAQAAIEQQLGHGRTQPQGGRQAFDGGRVMRQQPPGFGYAI